MGLIDTISNALNNIEISGTGLMLGFSGICLSTLSYSLHLT